MSVNVAAVGQIQVGALAAGNLALVVPAILGGGPLGYQPIAGVNPDGTIQPIQKPFLFHFEGENKVTMGSDITDHYIETNSAIQDGIALHPKIISVHGFIGELNDVPPNDTVGGALAAAKTVTSKLQGVSAYAPGLSTTATNLYNQAAQAYMTANSVYNSATSVIDSINGTDPAQGKQAQAFIQFEQWRDNRQLFNVQTPWKLYKNFAILDLVPTQDPTTSMITDFLITFKEMHFTSVNTLQSSNVPSVQNLNLNTPQFGSSAPGGVSTPQLGDSLYNESSAPVSIAAPSSGTAPSVQPGLFSQGAYPGAFTSTATRSGSSSLGFGV